MNIGYFGENYSGKEVHNEIFPDDYNSGTSPLEWNYVEIVDAFESWVDVSKYQSEKQKEYMLSQKLTRNGVTYDITAKDIGLNKARAESFATWKTKGSIYTKKIDKTGIYWGATFNVPPMAADAKLNSILTVQNGTSYTIPKEEEEISIPINFGGVITNMTDYVSSEDIKSISAELYINGNKVKNIKDEKSSKIEDSYVLTINKSNYPDKSVAEILVKCNTTAETKFLNDIPMNDSKEVILLVNIEGTENKNIVKDVNKRFDSGDKPRIVGIEIKRVTTDSSGKEKYVDLNIAKKTNSKFVCAGQVIYVRVKTINYVSSVSLEIEGDRSMMILDELTKKFEWDEPRQRGIKTRYKTLTELKKQYQMPLKLKLEKNAGDGVKYFSTIYVVPYKTKQTLNSWNTLREKNKNAFEIKESELFTRITNAYSLVFKARNDVGITTKRTNLDVFEAWNTIYNRDLTPYVK